MVSPRPPPGAAAGGASWTLLCTPSGVLQAGVLTNTGEFMKNLFKSYSHFNYLITRPPLALAGL